MWATTTLRLFAVLLVTPHLYACDATKSSNPLSPSVAGPMPGVRVTPPKLLEPGDGWQVDHNAQPVRLLLENSSSNGPRPLSYVFEVASDAGFADVVFSRGAVPPGDEGRTSIQLTDRLPPDVAFFWRAKAEDGANSSPYSSVVSFSIIPPVVIGVPTQLSPVGGVEIESNQPTFRMRNPNRSGPVGPLVYQLQVSAHEAFASPIATFQIGEQPNETQFAAPLQLPYRQTFFWRVRSFDTGSSGVVGDWSGAQAFRTPVSPPVPPPPSPGSPGNPCSQSTPLGILQCRRNQYGHMGSSDLVAFLRGSARDLNTAGIGGGPFGILRKSGGRNCGGYSCDIICAGQGTGQRQWDVLIDVTGAQIPAWNGPHTYPEIRVDVCETQ